METLSQEAQMFVLNKELELARQEFRDNLAELLSVVTNAVRTAEIAAEKVEKASENVLAMLKNN